MQTFLTTSAHEIWIQFCIFLETKNVRNPETKIWLIFFFLFLFLN